MLKPQQCVELLRRQAGFILKKHQDVVTAGNLIGVGDNIVRRLLPQLCKEFLVFLLHPLIQLFLHHFFCHDTNLRISECAALPRQPRFTDKAGFLRRKNIRAYAERLIEQYDVRSGQGPATIARSMSGGNQQKAIIAREIDDDPQLLVAVQPTRGLDVGAIEYIHKQLVAQRDAGKAVLLVSLELDEVLDVPDRILVMYEGEIVGELDPKTTSENELGLYMAGAKRDEVRA